MGDIFHFLFNQWFFSFTFSHAFCYDFTCSFISPRLLACFYLIWSSQTFFFLLLLYACVWLRHYLMPYTMFLPNLIAIDVNTFHFLTFILHSYVMLQSKCLATWNHLLMDGSWFFFKIVVPMSKGARKHQENTNITSSTVNCQWFLTGGS